MSGSDYLAEFYKRYRKGFQAFYKAVIDMGFTIVNSGYRGQDDLGSFPDLDIATLKTQENCKECHWSKSPD
ncbi:MAG: hypothetical protein KKD44_25540 [Proteobacteria bacterium]|nr:hypothetical protein [Pseudomonadota bacterium]